MISRCLIRNNATCIIDVPSYKPPSICDFQLGCLITGGYPILSPLYNHEKPSLLRHCWLIPHDSISFMLKSPKTVTCLFFTEIPGKK